MSDEGDKEKIKNENWGKGEWNDVGNKMCSKVGQEG